MLAFRRLRDVLQTTFLAMLDKRTALRAVVAFELVSLRCRITLGGLREVLLHEG